MPAAGQIDFYLKEGGDAGQELVIACKVVAKAWTAGFNVFVLCGDNEQSHRFDDLLWSFNQGSFIPHALAGQDPEVRVHIDSTTDRVPEDVSMVITLHPEPLAETFHHLRIADIIGPSEQQRAEARNRFRYYRSQGINPGMHRL